MSIASASAWLIRRFIDPDARFRVRPAKGYVPQDGELRFDMFEAEFTHEGDRCTFEVLLARLRPERHGADRHRRDRARHRPEGRQVRARGNRRHRASRSPASVWPTRTMRSGWRAAPACSMISTSISASGAADGDGRRVVAAAASGCLPRCVAHSGGARRSGIRRWLRRAAAADLPGRARLQFAGDRHDRGQHADRHRAADAVGRAWSRTAIRAAGCCLRRRC